MKVPSPNITKTLVAELKVLNERHQQFRTRVRAADEAARKRDEEARKQNAVLTQRIVTVESELKQAKESLEALRQFVELLPGVKSDFDSFEDEIEAFEVVGSDNSELERVVSVIARVDALDNGVKGILEVDQAYSSHLSDLLDGLSTPTSKFSPAGDCAYDDPKALGALPAEMRSFQTPASSTPNTTTLSQTSLVSPDITHTEPAAPPADTLTNLERFELIKGIRKEPLKNGEVGFLIPALWFVGWGAFCEGEPDQIGSEYRRIDTLTLIDDYGTLVESTIKLPNGTSSPNCLRVPLVAWNHLYTWYGCDSYYFPRLIMPDKNAKPTLSVQQLVFNLYFLFPPGVQAHGDYTPQIYVAKACSGKTLQCIVVDSLPSLPTPHSVEIFIESRPEPSPGWSVTHKDPSKLLEKLADEVNLNSFGNTIIVSIKVLDETRGCMVPIDPFPFPTSPPRILTWPPSCV